MRDESADDVRIVLEPRSKNVEPDVLMGMLYRNSDLEVRFSLNMNVLIDGVTPKVCSMKEVLRAFLDFRREVLIRRSRHRLQKIDHRNFETQESIDAAVSAALGDPSVDPSQLRWVKEGMVDLRSGPGLTFDRVAQVTKGTEVAVLEDPGHGWLNVRIVDSYETGWLAEWLVTEPE